MHAAALKHIRIAGQPCRLCACDAAVNVASTLVAVFLVDRLGRKFLLIWGGFQMIATEITVGVTLKFMFSKSLAGDFGADMIGKLPHNASVGVLVVICVFIAGFAWSWGPIGWL